MSELLDGLLLLFFSLGSVLLLLFVLVAVPFLFLLAPDWAAVVLMTGTTLYFLWTRIRN